MFVYGEFCIGRVYMSEESVFDIENPVVLPFTPLNCVPTTIAYLQTTPLDELFTKTPVVYNSPEYGWVRASVFRKNANKTCDIVYNRGRRLLSVKWPAVTHSRIRAIDTPDEELDAVGEKDGVQVLKNGTETWMVGTICRELDRHSPIEPERYDVWMTGDQIALQVGAAQLRNYGCGSYSNNEDFIVRAMEGELSFIRVEMLVEGLWLEVSLLWYSADTMTCCVGLYYENEDYEKLYAVIADVPLDKLRIVSEVRFDYCSVNEIVQAHFDEPVAPAYVIYPDEESRTNSFGVIKESLANDMYVVENLSTKTKHSMHKSELRYPTLYTPIIEQDVVVIADALNENEYFVKTRKYGTLSYARFPSDRPLSEWNRKPLRKYWNILVPLSKRAKLSDMDVLIPETRNYSVSLIGLDMFRKEGLNIVVAESRGPLFAGDVVNQLNDCVIDNVENLLKLTKNLQKMGVLDVQVLISRKKIAEIDFTELDAPSLGSRESYDLLPKPVPVAEEKVPGVRFDDTPQYVPPNFSMQQNDVCLVVEDENKDNRKPSDVLMDRVSYNMVEEKLNTVYNNDRSISSTTLDILALYLNGEKILYIEAKTYCEQQLNFLMLPTILISVVASVLSLFFQGETYGGITIASMTGFNSFMLALISYLKLDAKAEAHKTSAYNYEKLESMCEFNSGKVLFFNYDKKYVLGILEEVEKKVNEIKELNKFILPEYIRHKYPYTYSTNIFTMVKKIHLQEIILINRLKININRLIQTSKRLPRTPAVEDQIHTLETEQDDMMENIIRFREKYMEMDVGFARELDKNMEENNRRLTLFKWLKT